MATSKNRQEPFVTSAANSNTVRVCGVTLELKSARLLQKKDYRWHAIRSSRFKKTNATTSSIKEVKNWTNQTELQSFLELCKVFSRCGPNVRRVAAIFNKKPRKVEPTQLQTLSVTRKTAAKQLTFLPTNPPLLALPKADDYLFIDTNAWNTQLECVSIPKQKDISMSPIWHGPRTMAEPEEKLPKTPKQFLAVMLPVFSLHSYL